LEARRAQQPQGNKEIVGTVTTSGGRHLTSVDLKRINDATEKAYVKQAKKPTGVMGDDLTALWKRVEKYLETLGDKYKVPNGTVDNDAIVLYLQELSHFFEVAANSSFPGKPEAGVLGAMANTNHQTCILYLDSGLQGLYAYRHKPFDPNSRPKFAAAKIETDYFVGYADAMGNVPP
jgi:hypothetical protein